MAWPLLVGFALSFSLHFVDSFFLSRVSDEAAGAVGALLPIFGAAIVVFSAVGQAGGSVASQLLGARRDADVPVAYLALIGFLTALGVVVSAGLLAFHRELPELLGLTGTGLESAQGYLALLGGFQFLKAIQVAYANVLTSRGETRWVLAEAAVTNVCNVAVNTAFLHGAFGLPRLGVMGVALSTVLSLAAGLAFTMCVVHLRFRVRLPWSIARDELWTRTRSILRIGMPSALEPLSYQGMQIVVNTLVVTWGAQALAARVYVFNLVLVSTALWGLAFGIATQVLVAHRVGARRFEAAEAQLRHSLMVGMVGNFVLSALLAAFHRPILSIVTSDPQVHALASPLFFLGILVEPARAANIIVGGALRSSGDARYTAIIGTLVMWGVAVPTCYVCGRGLGLELSGIWLAFALDEGLRAFVNYRRWRAGNWRLTGVLVHRPAG